MFHAKNSEKQVTDSEMDTYCYHPFFKRERDSKLKFGFTLNVQQVNTIYLTDTICK